MIPADPSHILFYWIEDEEFLNEYARRLNWTPFEAACLLMEMLPGAFHGRGARVGRVPEPARDEGFETDPQNEELATDVLKLMHTLRSNYRDSAVGPSREIVRWALENHVISSRSFWVWRLAPDPLSPIDTSNPEEKPRKDGRGAHFSTKREHILGAALLAMTAEDGREAATKAGDGINAEGLANYIDDHRTRFKIPDGVRGYSNSNIKDTIRDALRPCKPENSEPS
jgi:hypothetical protein